MYARRYKTDETLIESLEYTIKLIKCILEFADIYYIINNFNPYIKKHYENILNHRGLF